MIVEGLSEDKLQAMELVWQWWRARSRPCFTLAGLAGSGKSVFVKLVSEKFESEGFSVLVVTPTGKAASVLREKGIDARTIHSRLYVPYTLPDGSRSDRPRKRIGDFQLIVVDESSMLDELTKRDILSHGRPVIFIGDGGQLPPPKGKDAHLMDNPDFTLTEIHRQHSNSSILVVAKTFREGRLPSMGKSPDGRLWVANKSEFWKILSPAFQMICGRNDTCHEVNRRIRKMLGLAPQKVSAGDKLVCLRNIPKWGLANGQQVLVLDVDRERGGLIDIEIQPDGEAPFFVTCLADQFGKEGLVRNLDPKRLVHFGYGACLTAHSAQGSEFPAVLVLDEVIGDPWRWRYTAATRARERLIYCL